MNSSFAGIYDLLDKNLRAGGQNWQLRATVKQAIDSLNGFE